MASLLSHLSDILLCFIRTQTAVSEEGWNPHSTGDYSDYTTDYSIGHQQLTLFDLDALLAMTATTL
jgi:hypothetical protein